VFFFVAVVDYLLSVLGHCYWASHYKIMWISFVWKFSDRSKEILLIWVLCCMPSLVLLMMLCYL